MKSIVVFYNSELNLDIYHFQVLVTDALAAFFLDRILLFLFGARKLNIRI